MIMNSVEAIVLMIKTRATSATIVRLSPTTNTRTMSRITKRSVDPWLA